MNPDKRMEKIQERHEVAGQKIADEQNEGEK